MSSLKSLFVSSKFWNDEFTKWVFLIRFLQFLSTAVFTKIFQKNMAVIIVEGDFLLHQIHSCIKLLDVFNSSANMLVGGVRFPGHVISN